MTGRPPIFETSQELDNAIQSYFNEGVKIRKVVVGKPPNQQVVEVPIPTITGLCYYIGFESRQSFYDYEKKPEFSYTVKRARLFIEQEYEEQLSVGNTVGAIFALKNMGWRDKTEQDVKHSGGVTIIWEDAEPRDTDYQNQGSGLEQTGLPE